MKRVIIELPSLSALGGADETDVALLLRDALGEFVSKRTPTDTYVENRYPHLRGRHRTLKEAEVSRRIGWAKSIAEGDVELELPSACTTCDGDGTVAVPHKEDPRGWRDCVPCGGRGFETKRTKGGE